MVVIYFIFPTFIKIFQQDFMQRRKAIQTILYFSVVTHTLISCRNTEEVIASIPMEKLKLKHSDLAIIDEISKIIFPPKLIPELKDHTALPFLVSMVDACYGPADQNIFTNGIITLNQYCQQQKNKDFTSLSSEEKYIVLQQLNEDKSDTEVRKFYSIVKDKTIQYFTTTPYYMRKYNLYEMAPGRFIPCVKIDNLQTKEL